MLGRCEMSKANKNKRLLVVIVAVVGCLAVAGAAQASEPNVGDRWTDPNGWQITELMYYDAYGLPVFYTTYNVNAAISTAADQIRNRTDPCDLNGEGLTVGIWDGGGVRATHQEFDGRVTIMPDVMADPNCWDQHHATHVAGTIGAEGQVSDACGMAPRVNLDSYEWRNDAAEMAFAGASHPNEPNSIYVSNHSYGRWSGWDKTSWYGQHAREWHWNPGARWDGPNSVEDNFGQYDQTARWWDLVAYNRAYYLIFKSAGNDRNNNPANEWIYYSTDGGATWQHEEYDANEHAPGDGVYKDEYDTIPTYGVAKNIMTIGAVNDAVDANGDRSLSAASMTGFSGWGPADDGRIKPDVVANGVRLYSCIAFSDTSYTDVFSGTSMASPDASGSAILLVEYYRDLFGDDAAMWASTLKGLIIHTADDTNRPDDRPGPDYCYGWGLMNAKAAADLLEEHAVRRNRIFEDGLHADNPNGSYTLDAASSPIRATLCWTDPPGQSTRNHDDRTARLVNDLDLRIVGPTGTTYHPYILDVNDPDANATTGDNVLDNVEQVYIESPDSGSYTVTVSHKGLRTGWQNYSLILSYEARKVSGGYFSQPTSTVKFSASEPIGPNQTVTLTAVNDPAPTMEVKKGLISVEVSLKDANLVLDIGAKVIEDTNDANDPNIRLRRKEYSEFTIISGGGHFNSYVWGVLDIGESSFSLAGAGGSGRIIWKTTEYGDPNRQVVENYLVTAQMQVCVTALGFSPLYATAYGTGTCEIDPNDPCSIELRMNAASYQLPYIVVDDFDSYANTTALLAVWDDYWVNGTGSEIFLETDANFTRDGNSMRYEYTNTAFSGGKYIGAMADANAVDLESGPDWTIGGVKALVLYFLGDPCTVISELGSVWPWLELEDTNSNTGWVMYPDPNHVTEQTWHEWNIDLSIFDACGVALSSIERLTIGIGGSRVGQTSKATTTNQLWFDDIRLYIPRCRPELVVTDLTGDCITDYPDLRIMSEEWLSSGIEADIVDDDNVNFLDYGLLADNWLTELLWP